VPSVPPGKFPLVHVNSLADAVQRAIEKELFGESFIISDGYLSLRELAIHCHKLDSATYVPIELPLPVISASVGIMEFISFFSKSPPLISRVQVKYVTQGLEVTCKKANTYLGWREMEISVGIERMFGKV